MKIKLFQQYKKKLINLFQFLVQVKDIFRNKLLKKVRKSLFDYWIYLFFIYVINLQFKSDSLERSVIVWFLIILRRIIIRTSIFW